MTRAQEWDEFLTNLLSRAMEDQQRTKEFEYLNQRREEIKSMLTTNLANGPRELVEEILYELELASERETGLGYRQGMLDCVWLLKRLGVLE